VALENEESTNANNIQEVMEEVEDLAESQDDTLEVLGSAESAEGENEAGEIGIETEVVETDFPQSQSLQEEMSAPPEITENKKILAAKRRKPTVQERAISNLRTQLKSQVDRNRSMQDLIKAMQSHLTRIDKVIYGRNKQQETIARLQVRLNEVQKKLDQVARSKIASSGGVKSKRISKPKSKPKAKSKLKSKKKTKKRS
jgi:hypothetical protein